ncbi:hypothetical protein CSKR_111474 [Clonorchis sinensis]|uniref:Uncharacterized protein n=1 Tax=Clonorchis sinensis TaxID=79923 RepID=A0A419Q5J6_CLOSI|nr:hypothetical protein CSKR_111474 [Clonorchis sinensis]
MHRPYLGEGEMAQWTERKFTDRKVPGLNPTSASRLPLSRLGQIGSFPALVLILVAWKLGTERVLQMNPGVCKNVWYGNTRVKTNNRRKDKQC